MAETQVALLRGINVGGHKKIKMAELRQALESREFSRVETYIQSGNIVLQSKTDPATTATSIHKKIRRTFDFDVPVCVLTAKDLLRVANKNPLLKPDRSNAEFLHVLFCQSTLTKKLTGKFIPPAKMGDDTFQFGKAEIFLSYPKGVRKTKLTSSSFEKQLGVACTARNWKTVTALKRMLTTVS